MTDIEKLEEAIKSMAEGLREDLELDGDWNATLFVVSGEDALVVAPIQHLLLNEEAKDVVGEKIIPGVIRKVHGKAMGIVMSAWTVILDAPDLDITKDEIIDMLVPPSQHPQRKEMLVIMLADQETERCLWAEIKRPEGAEHPELTEWQTKDGDHFEGRMWDEPLIALR